MPEVLGSLGARCWAKQARQLTIVAFGRPVRHLATGVVHAGIAQHREAEAAKVERAEPERHGSKGAEG